MINELDPRYGELIFDNIPHGIFTVDSDGRITSFNAAAERITGIDHEQAIGQWKIKSQFAIDADQQSRQLWQQGAHAVAPVGLDVGVEVADDLAAAVLHHAVRGELAGEGLGGGHADLRPAVHVDDAVADARGVGERLAISVQHDRVAL